MFFDRDNPFVSEVLISLLIFIGLVYVSTHEKRKSKVGVFSSVIVGCVVFCLFDYINGDYFHYKEHFLNIKNGLYSPFEDIYNIIISNSYNYLFFRLIIWGSAILVIRLIASLLEVNNNTFWYLFIIYSLLLFAYARVSLAITIATYGFCLLLCNKYKKIVCYPMGLCLILCSIFFHKSVLIVIALIPFSFLSFGKKSIITALFLLPVAIYFVNNFLFSYLITFNFSENQQAAVSSYILNSTGIEENGIARKILNLLEQAPTYFSAYIFMQTFNSISIQKKNIRTIIPLMRWAILIILCSTTFIIFPFTKVLYYRIMYLSRIPIVLAISVLLNQNILRISQIKYFCRLSLLCDFATFFYALYLSIVK